MNEILQRIDELLTKPNLSKFENEFLPSIKSHLQRRGGLTPAQLEALQKIEAKYSPAAQALHDEWVKNWDNQKKLAFKKVVDYYAGIGYYFTNILTKVRENPDYIPTEKEYNSIVGNKYAQRLLKNSDVPPKFQTGDLVQIRKGKGWEAGQLCVILEDKGITSWVKGGREYKVSYVNDNIVSTVRECDIKIAREKSIDVSNNNL